MAAYTEKRIAKGGKIRWRGVIQFRDPATGKRRSLTATFDTQGAAKDWLAERTHLSKSQGGHKAPSTETVATYIKRWLDIGTLDLKPGTVRRYRAVVNAYVLHPSEGLGATELRGLTPQVLRQWVANMSKRGLSAATVRLACVVLRRALEVAATDGLIPLNPMRNVRPPKGKSFKPSAFTREQAQAFVEATEGNAYRSLLLTLLWTAMRPGECFALRWSDIDLDAPNLKVKRAMVADDPEHRVETPKTKAALRTIPLSPQLVTVLRTHMVESKEAALADGRKWKRSDPVFPGPNGGLVNRQAVSRAFKKAVVNAEIEGHFTLYSLRHTAATLWTVAGVDPRTLAALMGHTDPAFTMSRYGYSLPESQHAAGEKMGALFT